MGGLKFVPALMPLLPLILLLPARAEPACLAGLYVVQLQDRPDRAALRQRLGPEHRRWVASLRGRIVAAGSLHAQPQAAAEGGLWLVRGADLSEVRALVQQDPYWRGGLRQALQIRFWCRGFPPGAVSL
ncbi:MAG: YciI family protein [Synechococcaceae cyanobacterium]|nr:YciI family protein [Synechococcaceae cyanobacterium]